MNLSGDGARPLVEIENLSKRYGSFDAVSQFSLNVGAGELFALLGPNGAGKTTTIRMLMGILQPTTGSARIGGLSCFSNRVDVMRLVGYLPDEPVFYDYLRGGEIIRFVGEMHGFSKVEIALRTGGLLQRLELADAVNEFAVNYSKGMKKSWRSCARCCMTRRC
jgi:ABC-2 type transport system ATP-binding protein